MSKVALVLAGLALVLAIAALVAGRVKFGSFVPGILVVAGIAIIGAFFALRSRQSVAQKAIVVTAIVVVVAIAIPASLKAVYPAYNHFFPTGGGTAGNPDSAQSGGAPGSRPSGGAKSGILVTAGSGTHTYGFIDPNSGKYSEVASFVIRDGGPSSNDVAVSPDFTKLAVTNQGSAGWIDTSGKFTSVTPKVDPGAFGGSPPSFKAIGFDAAGNFYYLKGPDWKPYKLAAGSTTNAQKIGSGSLNYLGGSLSYDGSMQVGCSGVHWLGPNNAVEEGVGIQITKLAVKDDNGCPVVDGSTRTPLLPETNNVKVSQAVGNHDGTKVAFLYLGDETALYIVAADGNSQPTKVNLTNLTSQQLSQMSLLRWQ